MSTPQWVTTLSLALEIPFDSTENTLWSTLQAKHVKFTDIFITTLTTIDIVRLPFIDFSFIKWFTHNSKSTQETVFMTIQANFQVHLRKRIQQELLALQESDKEQFLSNLSKLKQKTTDLVSKNPEIASLKTIESFLHDLEVEIKELEENPEPAESDS